MVGDASYAEGATAAYMLQQGVPVVGGISYNTEPSKYANFFPIGTTQVAQNYAVIANAVSQGKKNIASLYCAEARVCAEAVPTFQKIASMLGAKIGYSSKVSASAPNYTSICLAAKAQGVNAIADSLATPVTLRVLENCSQENYKPLIVGSSGTLVPSFQTNPATSPSLWMSDTYPFFSSATPASKEYRAALKKYEPSVVGTANDEQSTSYGWASGKLFQAALAGNTDSTITRQDVFNGIYALKNVTLGGLIPKAVTYVKGKVTFINCWYSIGISGGKFNVANGGKATCMPASAEKALGVAG
jgi:branched-chain amino acid transport system substrate-binding protein